MAIPKDAGSHRSISKSKRPAYPVAVEERFTSVDPAVRYFYRYGRLDTDERCEWLRSLLLDHRVFIPMASELNDMREARPPLVRKTRDEIRTSLRERLAIRSPDLSESEIHAEWQKHEDAIRFLGEEGFHAVFVAKVHSMLTGFRIYSMSKRWDNLSMWEWYGDKHRGFCIEMKNCGLLRAVREVVYLDEPVHKDVSVLRDDTDLFFTKHRDWSNEEEVRLVIRRKWGGPTFPIPADLITTVILGKDVSADRAAQIRAWGQERQPPVRVVTTQWDVYGAKLMIVQP